MIGPALRLSVVAACGATLIVAVTGVLAGLWLARTRFRGRELVDAVLSLPLVLPPTVTGYYLIALLGRQGTIGRPLHLMTGFSIPFTWVACVIAAAVMAFPLMLRSTRTAFESIDRRHEITSASLGHGPISTFFRIQLPLARRGILAGIVLAFARALGEFGATMMLAGNVPGRTQTLPLAIYEAVSIGEDETARLLAALLTGVSIVVMLSASRLSRSAP